MDPYRPGAPEPAPDLARLAAQGAARRAHAASVAQREGDRDGYRNLRTAIGAYRGSTLRRVILAVLISSVVIGGAWVATREGPAHGGLVAVVFGVAMPLFFLWIFVPPLASRGAVDEEAAWVAAQPFELVGYFDLLASTPWSERRVTLRITWSEGTVPPDQALMFGALGAVDPEAQLHSCDVRGAIIVSGPVSGVTGIRSNGVSVYRNHNLPGHVHALVERLLLPLHRSHSIARVAVEGK